MRRVLGDVTDKFNLIPNLSGLFLTDLLSQSLSLIILIFWKEKREGNDGKEVLNRRTGEVSPVIGPGEPDRV